MFAEFLGKETGYCKGRGGSMHIADPAQAATSAPTASSAAACRSPSAPRSAPRSARRTRSPSAFFGDGANNEGAFHESLNLASIWKLPVIFVCENNQYGDVDRDRRARRRSPNVADRASAYAMPGVIVDGNNFADVAEASFLAVERARGGDGPTLIEAKTYRTRGHSRSDRNRYRTSEEIESVEEARSDRSVRSRARCARPRHAAQKSRRFDAEVRDEIAAAHRIRRWKARRHQAEV